LENLNSKFRKEIRKDVNLTLKQVGEIKLPKRKKGERSDPKTKYMYF
jgi:hypothetical protein